MTNPFVRNIYENPQDAFEDERGRISDILVGVNISHIPVLETVKGAVRGNHYRIEGTQHNLVVVGQMEYWYTDVNPDAPENIVLPARGAILKPGDLVTIPPLRAHAMRAIEDSVMIVFSENLRQGEKHRKNTVSVDSLIGAPLDGSL